MSVHVVMYSNGKRSEFQTDDIRGFLKETIDGYSDEDCERLGISSVVMNDPFLEEDE